jgi:methanogenic corrinoid protein MtbC1
MMSDADTDYDRLTLEAAAAEQALLELASNAVTEARRRRDELVVVLLRRKVIPYAEIAEGLGITMQMVGKIAKAAGVQRRPRG